MPALRALPSKSLPALPQDYGKGRPRGSGGDPEVILLLTFVDWVKKIVRTDTAVWLHGIVIQGMEIPKSVSKSS